MNFTPVFRPLLLSIFVLALFQAGNAHAQAANPFARPEPPKPVAPAPQVPVPVLPTKLLEPEGGADDFSEIVLVATAPPYAVLRDGVVSYYVRDGQSFTYNGIKVRAKVKDDSVSLFSGKENEEVFNSQLGNGVSSTGSKSSMADGKAEDGMKEAVPGKK